MTRKQIIVGLSVVAIVVVFYLLTGLVVPPFATAHCDTLDGPVVSAAKGALASGDVTPVLRWVQTKDEAEIRAAFQRTLVVRSRGPEARDLADMYFFEPRGRTHRAGEGAPYDGIKPAGAVEPGIADADAALERGDVGALTTALSEHLTEGLRERFTRAMDLKPHADESVEAGRQYVEAYVEFIHYVERLHADIVGGAGHHGQSAEPSTHHGH